MRSLDRLTAPHLFIHVEERLDDEDASLVFHLLVALNKRFGCRATIAASTLQEFPRKYLLQALETAVVESVYFTGDVEHSLVDCINAARREGSDRTAILNWTTLVNDRAAVIRSIVDALSNHHHSIYNRKLGVLFCSVRALNLLPPPSPREPMKSWMEKAYEGIQNHGLSFCEQGAQWVIKGNTPSSSRVSAPTHWTELYVTRRGVNRFGGLARFKELPFIIGGTKPTVFDSIYLLDAENLDAWSETPGESNVGGVQSLPGMIKTSQGEAFVVDIAPAPYFTSLVPDAGERQSFELPRQLLQIRRTFLSFSPIADESIHFIVSNFNKETHIASSLYAMCMQTHPHIHIHLTDDVSTDGSLEVVRRFARTFDPQASLITVRINKHNLGTYWIRNEVLCSTPRANAVFLVNDSDDVSTAQRAMLQSSTLVNGTQELGVFFDVVRVDSQYNPLSMSSEVERYGTASLAMKGDAVDQIGYFENIKRNADTEYIERARTFKGEGALPWHRYACLFQVFDGNNLTSDIYTAQTGGTAILPNHNSRAQHTVLFRKKHQSGNAAYPDCDAFPHSTTPAAYETLGSAFNIPGYERPDEILIITQASDGVCERLANRGAVVLQYRARARSTAARGLVRILKAKDSYQSALSVSNTLRWVVEEQGFWGYVLVTSNPALIAIVGQAGPAIGHLKNEVLDSKRNADSQILLLRAAPDEDGFQISALELDAADSSILSDVMFHSRNLPTIISALERLDA